MSRTERQNNKTIAVNQPPFQADSFPFVAVLHSAQIYFYLGDAKYFPSTVKSFN